MVWSNDSGRTPMCEDSINGFNKPVPASFSSMTGFQPTRIPPTVSGFTGFVPNLKFG